MVKGVAVPLRAARHDVAFVQDIGPSADDDRVMPLATEQNTLLVPAEKG